MELLVCLFFLLFQLLHVWILKVLGLFCFLSLLERFQLLLLALGFLLLLLLLLDCFCFCVFLLFLCFQGFFHGFLWIGFLLPCSVLFCLCLTLPLLGQMRACGFLLWLWVLFLGCFLFLLLLGCRVFLVICCILLLRFCIVFGFLSFLFPFLFFCIISLHVNYLNIFFVKNCLVRLILSYCGQGVTVLCKSKIVTC